MIPQRPNFDCDACENGFKMFDFSFYGVRGRVCGTCFQKKTTIDVANSIVSKKGGSIGPATASGDTGVDWTSLKFYF